MKHQLTIENLISFLNSQDIEVSNLQADLLTKYYELLLLWSHRQNLFAAGDRDFLIERHFVPSFYFFYIIKKISVKSVIDVGSGAGFPGIIIQVMNPEISVTLIDSSRKKCLFLREASESLELRARIEHIRMENIKADDSLGYDVAVARFFGDPDRLWRWIGPLLKSSGILLVQKGTTDKFDVPTRSVYVKSWCPDANWINIAPTLSTKNILEVKKRK